VIIKIVILFLVFMGVLAMFGRLRFPGQKSLNRALPQMRPLPHRARGPVTCGKGQARMILPWLLSGLGW
jgi:hypothetical protein